MSTVANFFIEVKRDNKWELLTAYYPFTKRETKIYDDINGWRDIGTTPDAITVTGEELTKFDGTLYRQGHVRDIFGHSLIYTGFSDRGLPSDMSEGVKEWFDNANAKIEEDNRAYFEKYGVERTWGGKYWWGETYATLDEVQAEFDKEYKDWVSRLEKNFMGKYLETPLMKKMNEVIDAIKNIEDKKNEDEEENYYDEDIEYQLEDEIFNLFQLHSFVATVANIVESLNGEEIDDKNIRLIAFCE